MSDFAQEGAGNGNESLETYWKLYDRLRACYDAEPANPAEPWLVEDQFGNQVDVTQFAVDWFSPRKPGEEPDETCDDPVHVLVSRHHYGIMPEALGLDRTELDGEEFADSEAHNEGGDPDADEDAAWENRFGSATDEDSLDDDTYGDDEWEDEDEDDVPRFYSVKYGSSVTREELEDAYEADPGEYTTFEEYVLHEHGVSPSDLAAAEDYDDGEAEAVNDTDELALARELLEWVQSPDYPSHIPADRREAEIAYLRSVIAAYEQTADQA